MGIMTIGQVILAIDAMEHQGKNLNKKVMVSSDEEGNEFHTLWTTSIELCAKNGVVIGANYSDQKRDKNGYPKPVTLKELRSALKKYVNRFRATHAKEMVKDMCIYLTDDDEINGIHGCYYSFTDVTDDFDEYQFHDVGLEEAKKDWIIFG